MNWLPLIPDLLGSVGQLAKDIRAALTGELPPEKRAELEQRVLEIEFRLKEAQTLINIEEAKHPNMFVAGWRPFIGWVCGVALAFNYVIAPLASWVYSTEMPVLDTSTLMTLVLAMLGIAGYRTYEKVKEVQDKH